MNTIINKLKSEFRNSRNLLFLVFTFCMVAVLSFFSTSNMQSSSAANLNNFTPGNIISDAVMANYSSMSQQDIQNFLSSKNKCDNRDYSLYLQYTQAHPSITWHWEGEPYNGHFVCLAEERFGDTASEIGSGQTAAEIIYAAAQENKINPQALLVLLQKESSLITDKVPNSYDYSQATGYGCPDTAACDKKYSGFKNQVYRAAELFRYVLDNNSTYYPAGRTVYVGYHPSSSCGGTQVYIENRATAALYQYTPYQPNSAALNAGYGSGDSCSAYGNRNFYLYFTDWFGSTQAAVDGELITIPDGVYAIASKLSSERVIGYSGSNVELVALADDDSQRWEIKRNAATGYYTIANVATKRLLLHQGSEAEQGNNLQVNKSGTCNSLWKVYQTIDGYLTFESSCTNGMVIDINGAVSTIGANLDVWITNSGSGQKWSLVDAPVIPNGLYTIVSKTNLEQVLDINYASASNGATVGSWKSNGGENQQWQAIYDYRTGTYEFVNPYTNKALDLTSAKTGNGTKIETWTRNNGCAQRWKLTLDSDNESYQIISACSQKYALDLNGVAKNGAKITLWSANAGNNQRWIFQEYVQPIADGDYSIVSRISDSLALDVERLASIDGANVSIWSTHGGINQVWHIKYNQTNGSYQISSAASERALDISSNTPSAGTNVQVWQQDNTCGQRWYIYPVDSGYYRLVSDCNRQKSLDLNGGYTANGTNIQLWDRSNSVAQQWRFISNF